MRRVRGVSSSSYPRSPLQGSTTPCTQLCSPPTLLTRAGLHAVGRVTFCHRVLFQKALPGAVHGAILADAPGLGKSITTIALLRALYRCEGERLKCLLVCPATMVESWGSELRKWLHQRELPFRLLGGGEKSRGSNANEVLDFGQSKHVALLVASYESIVHEKCVAAHLSRGRL